MGCRILYDPKVGAALYCSTTDWAFGPLFESVEQAEAFLEWVPSDPRRYPDYKLQGLKSEFTRKAVECADCLRWFVKADDDIKRERCDHCLDLAAEDARFDEEADREADRQLDEAKLRKAEK